VDVVVLGEGEATFSEIIGRVLENNGKLPDETTLKEVKGIAFIEQGKKSIMRKINREIMFLDEAGEAFDREENTNLELPGRLADLAYIIYTSGSTGQPRGVTVEHKNLITYLNAFNNEFRLSAEDAVLQQATYSFDTFMEEVYPALLTGGKIAVPGKETVMDVYRLSDFIQKHRITMVDCSPLLLHQLNKPDTSHSLQSVRTFISGGDVLKGEYIDNLLKTGDVYNTYGPTEATICAAYYKCSGQEVTPYVSIGKPIAGYNLYILDKNGGPVPIGVPGELCIAGDGVTRGYLNNPDLTNSKFQRGWHPQPIRNSKAPAGHPLSFSASQLLSFSLYRTGDLVRWLPDGNIDFLGRLDHQVKIRGYRIELGEIQDRLLAHEKVLDAVVSVREDQQGDKYLCAYTRTVEEPLLREYLSGMLPDYMVPAHFVQLEQIPLSSNGKVDYKALPDPLAEIEAGEGYTPPQDETEEKLVQVWSEVLGIDKGRIGINTSFFHLGGHSLKATLVVTRLHKDLDIKISLFEVFSRPTIRELAEYVRGTAADRHVPLEAVEKKEYYILSSAQKRLYIQQQRDLDTTAFNLPQVFVLEGEVEVDKLQKTFTQLIRRHESLRTSFHIIGDEPAQRLHKDVTFEIEYYDRINDFIKPFDLTRAPLLRVGLIKEAMQQHLLLIDLHHIISDAVSQGILVRDFITLFSEGQLPFINIQYKDFAQWQESPEQRKRIKQQEAYWLKRFAGEIPCLNMPTDFERPGIQSFEGDILHFNVEGELYTGVRECMTETGTTLYMVLLAVYTILLSKYTRQQDIVVGSPVTGRTHDDLRNIIGMFVNMLPMRNYPFGGKTFREFLNEVKENALKAYDNQDYPFDELVIKLGLQGSSRPPVFETAFTLQDVELSGMAAREQGPAALRARPYDRFEHHIAQYDVTLDAIELKNSIHLWMRYVTALFKPATIETFKNYFLEILRQVVEKPDINIEDIRVSHEKIAVKSSIHKEDAGDFVF
jgi:amino acid adenylation domain-containing protein